MVEAGWFARASPQATHILLIPQLGERVAIVIVVGVASALVLSAELDAHGDKLVLQSTEIVNL